MKNKWKISFFGLLGIVLLIVIFFAFMLLTPASDENVKPKLNEQASDYVPLHVQSNKEDLNKLVNYYLNKHAGKSPVDYHVNLGNEVELNGKIPFFNEELNMQLTFDPEAQKNGDLILRQKTISVGRLNLPVPYVLQFIKENYHLPSGVEISPNKKIVYIDMQSLKLRNNMKVKVNTFDLKQNNIAFTILVPTK